MSFHPRPLVPCELGSAVTGKTEEMNYGAIASIRRGPQGRKEAMFQFELDARNRHSERCGRTSYLLWWLLEGGQDLDLLDQSCGAELVSQLGRFRKSASPHFRASADQMEKGSDAALECLLRGFPHLR